MADWAGIDNFLPPDSEARLARAWAWTVWPHLMSGSKMKAFSADDPIRLLAHNLDFWVPAVTATKRFPRGRQGQEFPPGHIGRRQCAQCGPDRQSADGRPRVAG
jgi:hypothetical protein